MLQENTRGIEYFAVLQEHHEEILAEQKRQKISDFALFYVLYLMLILPIPPGFKAVSEAFASAMPGVHDVPEGMYETVCLMQVANPEDANTSWLRVYDLIAAHLDRQTNVCAFKDYISQILVDEGLDSVETWNKEIANRALLDMYYRAKTTLDIIGYDGYRAKGIQETLLNVVKELNMLNITGSYMTDNPELAAAKVVFELSGELEN